MAEELFWARWSAIAQILAAVGTLAAVIVSLYLARRAEKPKLKLRAGVRLVVERGETGEFPKIVDMTVRNTGSLTAHLSQFGWMTGMWPFKWPKWLARQHAIQIPGETGYGIDPPYEVPPGQRRNTILDYDNFLEGIRKKSGPPFFARRWPLIGLRPTRIWSVAFLESGIFIRSQVESDLAKDLFGAELSRKAKPE